VRKFQNGKGWSKPFSITPPKMNNIHNALSNMLQDMDISDHYEGRIFEVNDGYDVTISAKLNPSKYVMIRVQHRQHQRIEITISRHGQMSPLFAQLVLENLAIQISPEYYD
jgi:hypothetical protein